MNKKISLAVLFGGLSMAGGCTSFWTLGQSYDQRDGVSSSLVDYLYPQGAARPMTEHATPQLELPLRVGIAFVPTRNVRESALSEATKNDLLEEVRAEFVDREYIEHIEVIPDTYLRSSTGFDGLQQVARLYGVDVMALVSYDQVSATEDRKSALLYWTIVGAYVVKGTENEVHTFVDTAVFDVNTKNLLFRAPGTDELSLRSTAIEAGESVRKGRNASFANAMEAMTANLATELDAFETRLKDNPSVANVSWKEGSGGGGSTSILMMLALLLICARRNRQLILAACGLRRRAEWSRR